MDYVFWSVIYVGIAALVSMVVGLLESGPRTFLLKPLDLFWAAPLWPITLVLYGSLLFSLAKKGFPRYVVGRVKGIRKRYGEIKNAEEIATMKALGEMGAPKPAPAKTVRVTSTSNGSIYTAEYFKKLQELFDSHEQQQEQMEQAKRMAMIKELVNQRQSSLFPALFPPPAGN